MVICKTKIFVAKEQSDGVFVGIMQKGNSLTRNTSMTFPLVALVPTPLVDYDSEYYIFLYFWLISMIQFTFASPYN